MNTNKPEPDWDPQSEEVIRDQRAVYDEVRERCPVAYSQARHWSIFRHEDVTRVLLDPATFSNAVSQHLAVPNGMDPPEHTEYRRIIDAYFKPDRMAAFEPICRAISADLLQHAVHQGEVEVSSEIALPFAVHVQCAFLGWPEDLHEPIIQWTQKNQDATRIQDRKALSEIAREFEELIDGLIETRTQADTGPEADITSALMHDQVWGRRLSNEEIASILRNWTVGEIGTISASIGILAHFMAEHPDVQKQLRENPALLPTAIDEILRLYNPLVGNRRITTCPVQIGDRKIEAGERISINWIAANRDGRVFDDPYTFRLDRDPKQNLLYGAGIHVCPGAPLARLEMRIAMEELLARTSSIELIEHRPPTHAAYPASGWASLPLRFRP